MSSKQNSQRSSFSFTKTANNRTLTTTLSTSLFPKPFPQYFCQCTSQITFPKTIPLIFLSMHLSNHFFQNCPLNISGSMHHSNHFFQNCPLNISGSMHLSTLDTRLSMSLFLKAFPNISVTMHLSAPTTLPKDHFCSIFKGLKTGVPLDSSVFHVLWCKLPQWWACSHLSLSTKYRECVCH